MADFITKDSSFKETSKEINRLKREIRLAEIKGRNRVVKLLTGRLKVAISAHKWRVAEKDEYSAYSYNPDDVYYEICFSRVPEIDASAGKKASGGLLNVGSILKLKSKMAASKAAGHSLPLKPMKSKKTALSRRPKEIRNYNDLVYFGERWDVSTLKFENCSIVFSYDHLRVISYVGMDHVFNAIKELGIPLDLSHHIKDLEKMERELELKRALIKDLSHRILFPV
jgi:hypothetical protein